MAFWTHAVKPIGRFIEKETGIPFEYSINDDQIPFGEEFPHQVWVHDGYRYADVKKTVAYIVLDEDEYGQPVVVKWHIKGNIQYWGKN